MQNTLPLPFLPKFGQSATNEDDGPKAIKELEEEGVIDIEDREVGHADP